MIQRTDRMAIALKHGWTLAEVYSAKDAWRKAIKRQPSSTLSFDQYIEKMTASGLRPEMIGLHKGKFSLARVNDEGGYHYDTCSFIPIEQNVADRKEGYQLRPEFRAKMSIIAKSHPRIPCERCGKTMPKSMLTRWHGQKCRSIATQHKETLT